MTTVKILISFMTALMGLTLVYGFTQGNGWAEVRELVAYPWFNVSLVDVYVGFALFSIWVYYRERSKLIAIVWISIILILGNLIACLYVLIALHRSDRDWNHFWMGSRRGVLKR